MESRYLDIFLGSQNLRLGAGIQYCKCNNCNNTIYHLQVAGMIGDGVIGLVSRNRKEIVITHLTTE